MKGLAWKLLYGNHRPSLGPDRWASLVREAGGPEDVKALALDASVPADAFARALVLLDDELGDGDGTQLERIGLAFVERWATMYQRLTEHLDQRPDRMLEVACREVHPWFFDGRPAEIEHLAGRSATLRLPAPLPEAFLTGWLEGMVESVGPEADAKALEGDRFRVTWSAPERTTPNRARLVIEATRARMLPATLAPVLVGTAVAAWKGSFDGVTFGLALAGAVCLHLAFNLLNDVLDHRRGVDEANLTPTPFAGGSRVIQRGWIGSDAMLALAGGLGLAGTATGLWLAAQTGWPVLALGGVGVSLGYAYSAAPFRLADRGLGEATAALVFGPLISAGAAAVHTGTLDPESLLAGLPVGAFMAAFLMVNELPDARWDARTGRRTLVVRLGARAATGAAGALLVPYLLLSGLVLAASLPVETLVGLATLPFAVMIAARVREAGTDADAIARLQAPTLILHATTGTLMAAGLAWEVLA